VFLRCETGLDGVVLADPCEFVASMPEIGLRFAPFPVGGMTGRFPASVRTSGTYDGASNTVERLA